jgi:hypothetical protein
MKKLIFLLLISAGISASAQQMVRGYTASFSYGFLAKGDDFTIKYGGVNYLATARKTQGSCISLGFPFDFGIKRSRLVFTPGLDFMSSNYTLDVEPDMFEFGSDSDSLRLSSFMVIPQFGFMYKYHFYVGKLHFAIGAGLDFKIPVSNSITLTDKNKTDLIEYSELPDEYGDALIFRPNTVYSNLADIGFHINPKIGFDIHVAKYLVTNLFYTTSPLTNYSDEPAIRGYAGFGATYLMPLGKEDDSRLLQYYKQ